MSHRMMSGHYAILYQSVALFLNNFNLINR